MAGIGPDSSQFLRLPRPTRGYERTVCASCGLYGTDRCAHADFFRAPRDEERDDAEEANGAQDETPPDSFQGQIPGTDPANPAVPMEGDLLKVNVDYFRAMGMRVYSD